MSEQTKNMLIGVFVLAACALIVWIILFLKPSIGDGKKTLYVRFANINKIGIGTRVTFAGKPVGEVVSVDQIFNARGQPADEEGEIYFYQLVLKVDSSVVVYNTDTISLQTSGLLGEKSVAIEPKIPPPGVIPKEISNQPIYAVSIDPLEHAFNELSKVAGSVQKTFDQISDWIGHNQEALTNIVNSVDTVTNDLATGQGTLGKLITQDDFYLKLSGTMNKIDTLMNDINHYGILFHLNKAWQRTHLKRLDLLDALQTPTEFKQYFQEEVSDINTSMNRLSLLIDRAQESPESEIILQTEAFKRDFAELLRQSQLLNENLKLYNEQLTEAQGG